MELTTKIIKYLIDTEVDVQYQQLRIDPERLQQDDDRDQINAKKTRSEIKLDWLDLMEEYEMIIAYLL